MPFRKITSSSVTTIETYTTRAINVERKSRRIPTRKKRKQEHIAKSVVIILQKKKKNSTKKAAKLTNPKERNTEGRKKGRSQAANQHRDQLHTRNLQDDQHSQDHCCSVSFFNFR